MLRYQHHGPFQFVIEAPGAAEERSTRRVKHSSSDIEIGTCGQYKRVSLRLYLFPRNFPRVHGSPTAFAPLTGQSAPPPSGGRTSRYREARRK